MRHNKKTIQHQELVNQAGTAGKKAIQKKAIPVIQSVSSQEELPRKEMPNTPVAQLVLRTDFRADSINMAMAGEQHNEIPIAEEKAQWGKIGVTVHHESDEITHRAGPRNNITTTTPDPPILRMTHLWSMYNTKLSEFWQGVVKGEDIDELDMNIEDIKRFYQMILDELEVIGPIAPEIVEMEDALKTMQRFLPPSTGNLKLRSPSMKLIMGQEQLSNTAILEIDMRKILNQSSFRNVAFDEGSLMTERSKQMLLNANKIAAGTSKTIYKVGNEHIEDMDDLDIVPIGKLKMMDRDLYLDDYRELKGFNADQGLAGNARVFRGIGNEDLDL